MLQELMARQARDAAAITSRLDFMQAEIDSRAPAIDALHAGAAAPGATASAASGGDRGWLRSIITGARSPAAPAGQLAAAAPSAADAPSTPAPLAAAPRARFDLTNAMPPGAPSAPTRGSRRLPPSWPAACDDTAASASARRSTVARSSAAEVVDLDEDDGESSGRRRPARQQRQSTRLRSLGRTSRSFGRTRHLHCSRSSSSSSSTRRRPQRSCARHTGRAARGSGRSATSPRRSSSSHRARWSE
jgi:hypothetical protein